MKSGMNTILEQVRTIADSYNNRFHVLLTMPDGTYRTIMNATADEHDGELRVYAAGTIVLFRIDRNGFLYPMDTDRLPCSAWTRSRSDSNRSRPTDIRSCD